MAIYFAIRGKETIFGAPFMEVSFQWKNPDFLTKNPDFRLKNVDF